MNKCPICGTTLVSHEYCHAYAGELYCSKSCCVSAIFGHLEKSQYTNACKRMRAAEDTYNAWAEEVPTADVLKEDLQAVEIKLVCKKRIVMPKSMEREAVLAELKKHYEDGLVTVDVDDADEVEVTYTLIDVTDSPEA